MMEIGINTNFTESDKKWFGTRYPDHNLVGFMWTNDDDGISHVVLKMKPGHKGWTPQGTVRDCGDYYIIARYSRYDRIDKKTRKITKDVEDC